MADWTANFAVSQPGVDVQWQFSFAAYSDFTTDLPSLQPLATQDGSSRAAGTPQDTRYSGGVLFGGRDLGNGTCVPAPGYASLRSRNKNVLVSLHMLRRTALTYKASAGLCRAFML